MQSTQAQQSHCWSFFEAIYCIVLEERPDRLEKVRQQFTKVGLASRVEIVLVNRHPTNREQGIMESHLICLNKGLAAGAQTMLIFEDDVFFEGFDPAALTTACDGLKENQWDMLLLGGIASKATRTGIKNLLAIEYRCLTHAYAVTREYARIMAQKPWNGEPWDSELKKTRGQFYTLYPMCAFQGLEGTENQTTTIAWLRTIFGGLPFLQRLNEFYQLHKWAMLLSPALLPALILLAWMAWS